MEREKGDRLGNTLLATVGAMTVARQISRPGAPDDSVDDPRLPELVARLAAPGGYQAFEAQVHGARFCRRPVRLNGSVVRPDTAGPPQVVFDSASPAGRGLAQGVRDQATDPVPAVRLDLPG